MIRFFNKITKTIIMILGFIILIAITAVGAVGLNYKDEANSLYSTVKNAVDESSSALQTSIESVKTTLATTSGDINTKMTSLTDSITNLSDQLTKLKEEATAASQPTADIDNAIATINSLKETIPGIQSTVGDVPKNLDSIISNIQSSGVYTTIQNIIDKLPSEKEFNDYYGNISLILTAVGGSVLGIYALTIISGFIFFKHTCGVRVRRFHKRNDLIKHIDKVFEKYPELHHEFYPNN